MDEQSALPYKHIIIVTIGLSVIEKTLGEEEHKTWMGTKKVAGKLARLNVSDVEQGIGDTYQREVEKKCFDKSRSFGNIGKEILRKKQNPYSAEVSSLYLILKDKSLDINECRIVLLTTDSPEGVFAARLNKRIIAHRLFNCHSDTARDWAKDSDDDKHPGFGHLPIIRVPGLKVENADEFKVGIAELENIVSEENSRAIEGIKLLNISGGFKGVIPVAASTAWRYRWDVTYLYEETSELVYCPRPLWIAEDPDYRGPSNEVYIYGPV